MAEAFPEFTRAEGESWFVCHTRPRCEKKFAELMKAERMVHYLPLVDSVREYADRTKHFTKPLFAGYVFTRIALEQKPRIYQLDLLARAIPVDDETRFLRQLADVRQIISSGLAVSLHPVLARGTRVKVISGPLWGLEGVVDDPNNPKGIVLSVDVLQQGVLVRVPAQHLKPLLD